MAALPCLACPCGLQLLSLEMYYLWYGVDEIEAGNWIVG